MTRAAETRWTPERRLAGLWRFAIAISIVNLLGHTLLGFEQPAAVPFVSLATAYGVELLLEAISAWGMGRPPRYRGGPKQFVEFLLSAHISALAVGMLLYANDQLWLVVFASALAIASKMNSYGRQSVLEMWFLWVAPRRLPVQASSSR